MPDQSNNDPGGCNAILIPHIDYSLDIRERKLDTLRIINEKTWEKLQSQAEAGLNLGFFEEALEMLDIELDASYSDFDQRRRDYFRHEEYHLDESSAAERLQSGLRPDVIRSWENCKLAFVGTTIQGFHIWPEYEDESRVILAMMLNTTIGQQQTARVISSTVMGGRPIGTNAPDREVFARGFEFMDERKEIVQFERNQGENLSVSVCLNPFGCESLVVPAFQSSDPPPEPAIDTSPVWTEWSRVNIPPAPSYGGHVFRDVSVTIPEGRLMLPHTIEYFVSWGGGRGGAWGRWAGGPKFDRDERTVSRRYDHWKHDAGRQIGIRVQHVPKVG